MLCKAGTVAVPVECSAVVADGIGGVEFEPIKLGPGAVFHRGRDNAGGICYGNSAK